MDRDGGAANARRMTYQPTHIRAWRRHRNLTLERLGDRVGMAPGNLSRLERGITPYIQHQIEAIADALRCTVADLISRPPGATSQLQEILGGLSPEKQRQAVRLIKALAEDDAA